MKTKVFEDFMNKDWLSRLAENEVIPSDLLKNVEKILEQVELTLLNKLTAVHEQYTHALIVSKELTNIVAIGSLVKQLKSRKC